MNATMRRALRGLYKKVHPDLVGSHCDVARRENQRSMQLLEDMVRRAALNDQPDGDGLGKVVELRFHVLMGKEKGLKLVDCQVRMPPTPENLFRALRKPFQVAGVRLEPSDFGVENSGAKEETDLELDAWEFPHEFGDRQVLVAKLFKLDRIRIVLQGGENPEREDEIMENLMHALLYDVPEETLAELHGPVGGDLLLFIGGDYFAQVGRTILFPEQFDSLEFARHLSQTLEQIKEAIAK